MKSFDLTTLINNHNRLHPDRYISTEKTWGLSYLRPEGLALLNSALVIINNIKQSPSYRNQSNKFSSMRRSLQALKRIKPTQDFLREAKILSTSIKEATAAQKIHSWEEEQAAWLNNGNNWEKLIATNSEAKGSLIKLKNLWDMQKTFSLCSNEFLLQALKALAEAIEHLVFAENEFKKKRHKLPNFVAEEYGAYLSGLRCETNRIKESLLNSMLSRLIVADKMSPSSGHLYNDDVLAYTISELQRYGILKKSMHVAGHWQTLQPQHLSSFQKIIQSQGSPKQAKALLQLSWFDHNRGTISLMNFTVDKTQYVAPTQLQKYIPSHKRQPVWLFKSQHQCINFVEQHQAIFASLNIAFPNIVSLEQPARFKHLDCYEQQLNSAMHELQKIKPKSWQLWSYFGYRKLLDEYQKILICQSQRCDEERIKLLEEIAQQELPPKESSERHKSWSIITEQLNYLAKQSLSSKLKTRLNIVSKNLSISFKQEPGDIAAGLIAALANKQKLQLDELSYLLEYMEINDLSIQKCDCLIQIKSLFPSVIGSLISQLKSIFMKQEMNDELHTIRILLMLVKAIEKDMRLSYVSILIKQMLAYQTTYLTEDAAQKANQRLLQIQKLIYEFGDHESIDLVTRIILDFTSSSRFLITDKLAKLESPLSCATNKTIQNNALLTRNSFFNLNEHSTNCKTHAINSEASLSNHCPSQRISQ